jgi:hypothetical protein
VLKVLDMDYAVALAAPRRLTLHLKEKVAPVNSVASASVFLQKIGVEAPVVLKVVGE